MTTATMVPCKKCINGQAFFDRLDGKKVIYKCLQCGGEHKENGELIGRFYATPTQGNFSRDSEGLKERQSRKNYGLKRRR